MIVFKKQFFKFIVDQEVAMEPRESNVQSEPLDTKKVVTKDKISRVLYCITGHGFVVLGYSGTVIPGLPTVPFLLCALFCYKHGSPRFYNWLLNQPVVGPSLRAWKYDKSIPLYAKIMAVSMITLSIGWGVYSFSYLLLKAIVLIIGFSVSVFIITRPTTKQFAEETAL